MLIYTSYFAQVKNLPSDIVPISIAAKQVPGWRYPVYKALAPTYNIFMITSATATKIIT